jgi:hypothetical protein
LDHAVVAPRVLIGLDDLSAEAGRQQSCPTGSIVTIQRNGRSASGDPFGAQPRP